MSFCLGTLGFACVWVFGLMMFGFGVVLRLTWGLTFAAFCVGRVVWGFMWELALFSFLRGWYNICFCGFGLVFSCVVWLVTVFECVFC